MNLNSKRISDTVWRIGFAGLVILIAWLALLALHGAIPSHVIDNMNAAGQNAIIATYDSSSWDWSTSFRTGEPVWSMIGGRLWPTIGTIALTGLFSLIIASILLFLGTLITRATVRPGWLANLRKGLRLVLISGGAGTPIFLVGVILTLFLITVGWEWTMKEGSAAATSFTVFIASLLPAWLLVQAGHGEMAGLPEDTATGKTIRHLALKLVIRLLRMIGLLIVLVMAANIIVPGNLGTMLRGSLLTRDFPVVFSITFLFVVIVVIFKLIADLMESWYQRSSIAVKPGEAAESALKSSVPKGWMIACFVLVGLTLLIALFGPMLAPYGYNEIFLTERLAGPSSTHLLGTDNLGRDILSRLLYGTRIDVVAGLVSASILLVLATSWTMAAGYFRRMGTRTGRILEKLVVLPAKVITAVPWLALLLLITSMLTPDSKEHTVLVTLAITLVLLPRGVAMLREAYLSVPEKDGWLGKLLRAVPVMFIFAVGGSISYMAAASYMGLGTSPPLPELGSLLSGTSRQYLLQSPGMVQYPALWLSALLLIWVMAGDVLLEKLGFRSKAVWVKVME